jgi:hypothetical protein
MRQRGTTGTVQTSIDTFGSVPTAHSSPPLSEFLVSFTGPAGQPTWVDTAVFGSLVVPRYTNEFWTAQQRQAASSTVRDH